MPHLTIESRAAPHARRCAQLGQPCQAPPSERQPRNPRAAGTGPWTWTRPMTAMRPTRWMRSTRQMRLTRLTTKLRHQSDPFLLQFQGLEHRLRNGISTTWRVVRRIGGGGAPRRRNPRRRRRAVLHSASPFWQPMTILATTSPTCFGGLPQRRRPHPFLPYGRSLHAFPTEHL